MNIEICKKCKLKPYLWFRENYVQIDRKYISCSEIANMSQLTIISSLNDDVFDKMISDLTMNGYDHYGYVTMQERYTLISLIDNYFSNKNKILSKVEINEKCPYQLEHQMNDWNEK